MLRILACGKFAARQRAGEFSETQHNPSLTFIRKIIVKNEDRFAKLNGIATKDALER